jgi:serine protease Do
MSEIVILLIVGSVMLYRRQQKFEESVVAQIKSDVTLNAPQAAEPKVIEQVVSSSSQIWRPVQERAKDTVVQIFAHITESDLFQPYQTPVQRSASGSGFFINDKGDLITNAHVVNEATGIWIQIPSLGKKIFDVDIVSISPDRDLALLRLRPEGLETIRKELGAVPFLPLGDSDLARRSDEVLALGYPLGQQSLKSTIGVISGPEHHLLQTSAPINPGNSGGPLVNTRGEVIGINEANVPAAQNVGYAIPINVLKTVLPDMYDTKLLRKPFLGILFTNATEAQSELLGNPHPGACYVVEVVKGSTLERAGVKEGDMIYEIDGHRVDIFGEMSVPWNDDKISLIDYVSRLSVGQVIKLVIYRNGVRKNFSVTFKHAELPAIRRIYPGYEDIDYEIFAGMVITPLTLNHIFLLAKQAPGLAQYAEAKKQSEPALFVSHIFPNSQLYRSRTMAAGATLQEVNGVKVKTLDDLRAAIRKPQSGKFFTIKASDNVAHTTGSIFVVLPWQKIVEEELKLSKDYRYPLSNTVQEILRASQAAQTIAKGGAPVA